MQIIVYYFCFFRTCVQCHYEGTLIDGTLFDSSIKRGQPATFGVSQVIPGWVEALRGIQTGGAWLSSARVVRCWVTVSYTHLDVYKRQDIHVQ